MCLSKINKLTKLPRFNFESLIEPFFFVASQGFFAIFQVKGKFNILANTVFVLAIFRLFNYKRFFKKNTTYQTPKFEIFKNKNPINETEKSN